MEVTAELKQSLPMRISFFPVNSLQENQQRCSSSLKEMKKIKFQSRQSWKRAKLLLLSKSSRSTS